MIVTPDIINGLTLEGIIHIVLVHIHVKPEFVERFIAATLENATNSLLEAGVVRFDFYRQVEDENRFTLVEVYQNPADQLAHRETKHYLTWRDTVNEMMAEPRIGIKYTNLHPADKKWS